jgi:hypothetical protein
MATTSHDAVLNALSHQAIVRGKPVEDPTHLWSIDETGRLDSLGFDLCKENDVVEQEIREINTIAILDAVLQVHGFAPPKKAEGTVHLIYENVNVLNN